MQLIWARIEAGCYAAMAGGHDMTITRDRDLGWVVWYGRYGREDKGTIVTCGRTLAMAKDMAEIQLDIIINRKA